MSELWFLLRRHEWQEIIGHNQTPEIWKAYVIGKCDFFALTIAQSKDIMNYQNVPHGLQQPREGQDLPRVLLFYSHLDTFNCITIASGNSISATIVRFSRLNFNIFLFTFEYEFPKNLTISDRHSNFPTFQECCLKEGKGRGSYVWPCAMGLCFLLIADPVYIEWQMHCNALNRTHDTISTLLVGIKFCEVFQA